MIKTLSVALLVFLAIANPLSAHWLECREDTGCTSWAPKCQVEEKRSFCVQQCYPNCLESKDNGYAVASEPKKSCSQNGMTEISSEAKCQEACSTIRDFSDKGVKEYSTGSWGESPGCFIVVGKYRSTLSQDWGLLTVDTVDNKYLGNCHWNTDRSATWTSPESRAVCMSIGPMDNNTGTTLDSSPMENTTDTTTETTTEYGPVIIEPL